MQAEDKPLIIFCAYGTRGDVQPLAVLARYTQETIPCRVCLVTHQSHQVRCMGYTHGCIPGLIMDLYIVSDPCLIIAVAWLHAMYGLAI